MMSPDDILQWSIQIGLVLLSVSFLATVMRVIVGPTLPDRIIALDLLVAAAIGFIAILAIKTGFTLYLDIAIALGLVGFLATVAFARFVLNRGRTEEDRAEHRPTDLGKSSATRLPGEGSVSATAQNADIAYPIEPMRQSDAPSDKSGKVKSATRRRSAPTKRKDSKT